MAARKRPRAPARAKRRAPAGKPPRTRAEAKQVTRAALIAAGVEEFARHGLDASLDAICARAGLTRGAFYVHFADREAFLVATMTEVLGDFVAALTGVDAGEPGAVARAVGVYFAAAAAHAPAVHAGGALRFSHVMDACRRAKHLGETYRALVLGARDRVAEAIAVDQAAGLVRADRAPAAVADVMTVMGLGVAAALELEVPFDLARLGETLLALVAHGGPARAARAARRR